jgi:hypothetical protein
MQRPLEIAFHGLHGSPALEEEIRQHVRKLEGHCTDLISCRVTLESDGGKSRLQGYVGVPTMLGLPGCDLAITNEPHHETDHRAHADARTALCGAFRAEERRVRDRKAQSLQWLTTGRRRCTVSPWKEGLNYAGAMTAAFADFLVDDQA